MGPNQVLAHPSHDLIVDGAEDKIKPGECGYGGTNDGGKFAF